jgi:hypothetical protein
MGGGGTSYKSFGTSGLGLYMHFKANLLLDSACGRMCWVAVTMVTKCSLGGRGSHPFPDLGSHSPLLNNSWAIRL